MISIDARTDPRFRDRESVRLYDIRSVLCLPLKVEERTIGTVYLDYPGKGDVFSPKQIPFYAALADLPGVRQGEWPRRWNMRICTRGWCRKM
ncbi:MAG TPA: GAF domain-containing protein [Candidatus Latescibacteria bacterium]|nr:GAF domain-containing protein [Candidatus Latescibacterota bacterium]